MQPITIFWIVLGLVFAYFIAQVVIFWDTKPHYSKELLKKIEEDKKEKLKEEQEQKKRRELFQQKKNKDQ